MLGANYLRFIWVRPVLTHLVTFGSWCMLYDVNVLKFSIWIRSKLWDLWWHIMYIVYLWLFLSASCIFMISMTGIWLVAFYQRNSCWQQCLWIILNIKRYSNLHSSSMIACTQFYRITKYFLLCHSGLTGVRPICQHTISPSLKIV